MGVPCFPSTLLQCEMGESEKLAVSSESSTHSIATTKVVSFSLPGATIVERSYDCSFIEAEIAVHPKMWKGYLVLDLTVLCDDEFMNREENRLAIFLELRMLLIAYKKPVRKTITSMSANKPLSRETLAYRSILEQNLVEA